MAPGTSLSVLEISAIFLSITALLTYVNHRFIGLPTTIGVMVISMLLSIGAIFLGFLGFDDLIDYEVSLLDQLDFTEVLLDGMLSMLLFAGALHVNVSDLRRYKLPIGILACVGTLLSTVIIAGALYLVLPLLGFDLAFIWCLLFGALISPTDPIAVMGILQSAGAPKSIETVIAGESLFNDGIGVVIFVLLLGVLSSGDIPTTYYVAHTLAVEAGGGIVFGLVLGGILYYLLKSIDSYQEEVLLTLAGVIGGYALASHWHLSGPLAMVMMGLMVGNHGRSMAMSDKTRHYVDLFWELIDEILNAILFVLIGLEVVMIAFSSNLFIAGGLTILIALMARLIVVGITTTTFNKQLELPSGAWKVLTWGGLRGGISVALVLQLPDGNERDILLALTYAVVVFSILIQGLSIGKVAKTIR
ncbi:sodium:proton antiporter [Pseudoalteromonas sp. Hal273]|jgi:CPA1 family monovalent cation:H+ antiporter|uniref:Sodium:proton antiporter n=3 Tax=Pseudoalteromonas TaxID=53246 RepID=F3BQA1_9GAMM|nr:MULTISPECIES: sodium:proton antiporter [Pseudoalteromonas]EGI71205.1 Na+/H+ antiporter, CPA1 family [Pseudoalteromonas distincta]MBB1305796.1 sodium:proton antiporter [Pseudoalteromonas sp. SR43-5]MBB1355447.1 sodium:proton antiporter [Pseudoalteromonas sp. SR45-5]MBB1431879.1 sodium:proton antiporter [Pseudoalteromonas sp. SG43-4]MBH0013441.1 sodium:proton antiporter [Pseudoalteromonas sp. NZS100_1]|tara:strand:- start:7 stop:1257 length:1251 start_codon:yes stop_codon:yes gene_type:complete